MRKRIITYLLLFFGMVMLAACSTTSRLGEEDILYTGVKHTRITTDDKNLKVPPEIKDNIHTAVKVAANNSLYAPYIRSPFPIGLWVYNHWSPQSKGIKGWFYRKLVEEPVLISDVRPDLRMKMVEDMLAQNGYFGSTTSYELLYDKRNPKKARVNYSVRITRPKHFCQIRLLADTTDTTEITRTINRLANADTYLQQGSVYCTDSLLDVRNRIANNLRNRGYYYFRPEYISYLADTTMVADSVVVQMTYTDDTPKAALRKYKIGRITSRILLNKGGGYPDTIHTNGKGIIVQMKPSELRENLIPSCIAFREGDPIRVRQLSRTQSQLSRLGIFSSISLDLPPLDSLHSDTDAVDININCRFDTQLETQLEANLTSKSNSYLGPGLSYSVTNRNIFGGGEKLTIGLSGSYEWQIGKVEGGKRSDFNSYEVGLKSELAFPRLIAPKFIPVSNRSATWSRFSLGGDIMNRPRFFRMAQFNLGLNYDWMASAFSKNQITLFELKYNKLIRKTAEFSQTMNENPAIAMSFEDQFIPKFGYTYSYDRNFSNRRNRDRQFTLQLSLVEGGNLFSGIWRLAGDRGQKRLFGTPFSQFIKGTASVTYSHLLAPDQRIVARIMTGAAHAYGNSQAVPYNEQFYIGGANSIRAFAVRSVGPGRYHSSSRRDNGYYDQTGTFRFEMNLEYRFPIAGMLKGALFADAGNIWLLKDDPARPGGKLSRTDFLRDLALGTGVGLRFDMGMLVIRGDLGYGLHLPYDTGHSGYFNVGKFGDSLAFNLAIGYPF